MKKLFLISFGGAIVVAVLVIALVASRNTKKANDLAAKFPSWISVNGTVASFHATFPTQPQAQAQDLPVPNSSMLLKQEVFAAQDNGVTYTLAVIVYPTATGGDEEENLQAALQGMTKSLPPGAALTSSRMRTDAYGNNKALEFVIGGPSPAHMKGQLRLKGNTMYQMLVNYTDPTVLSEDAYSYFVGSLSLQ